MVNEDEECTIHEKRHPPHTFYSGLLARIFRQVPGQQCAEHISAQIGYKYGGAGMHACGVHKAINSDTEYKSKYQERPYRRLKRQQQNKKRVNIRYEDGEAGGLIPPAQSDLIEDKHLQQDDNAKA